jgi:hypothetical protein
VAPTTDSIAVLRAARSFGATAEYFTELLAVGEHHGAALGDVVVVVELRVGSAVLARGHDDRQLDAELAAQRLGPGDQGLAVGGRGGRLAVLDVGDDGERLQLVLAVLLDQGVEVLAGRS